MTPSAGRFRSISGSIISTKFNNKINNNMSGGRIALPIEYFGTQTSNYLSNVQTTEVDPSLVRNGISFTGGMGESERPRCGLLNYKDFKQFNEQYEHKFLRKLIIIIFVAVFVNHRVL